MNIKESFISVFTNWKNFRGRACRSEYWYFQLSITLISFLLMILEVLIGTFNYGIGYGPLLSFFYGYGPLTSLFNFICFIPIISVTSRRLQDRGISGWWQLSYFTIVGIYVILILNMLPAKEDENKWGRNPLLDI